MCDAEGNVIRRDGHPESTEIILELSDDEAGTHMSMTHVGVPSESQGGSGWKQAFDKLEAIVSRSKETND
jgi:hypothetical protein